MGDSDMPASTLRRVTCVTLSVPATTHRCGSPSPLRARPFALPHFLAFGGTLASELAFPELPIAPADRTADWTLRLGAGAAPALETARLGVDKVYGSVQVHAASAGGGIRLAYDDTGTFDVSADGRDLTWYPPVGSLPEEAARADVIGRVLAMAMHLQGVFTLHASAVSVAAGTGIALMAPKGYGKSTLAAALLRSGAALISDDAVPVRCISGGGARLLPGIHQVRLWGDAAERVGLGSQPSEGRKLVVTEFEHGRLVHDDVDFVGAYVLTPVVPNPDGPAVERVRLTVIDGALSLIEHSKVGALLGGREGPRFFDMATTVASRVPVYALRITRDLGRLDEVTRVMTSWHA